MIMSDQQSGSVLRALKLSSDNAGVSAGRSWLGTSGPRLLVHSPLDGRTLPQDFLAAPTREAATE